MDWIFLSSGLVAGSWEQIIEPVCFMTGGQILVAEEPLASIPRGFVVSQAVI